MSYRIKQQVAQDFFPKSIIVLENGKNCIRVFSNSEKSILKHIEKYIFGFRGSMVECSKLMHDMLCRVTMVR